MVINSLPLLIFFITFALGGNTTNIISETSPTISLEDSIKPNQNSIDTLTLRIRTIPEKGYKQSREEIQIKRKQYANVYKSCKDSACRKEVVKEAGCFFEEALVNQIIPHWYGTPWDFNGFSATPKQGTIACGYFVSTTLLHAGINLNRYHLAQKGPEAEAQSLACGEIVLSLVEMEFSELEKYFHESLTEGLYFCGLQNHVGYVLYRNGKLLFIHSNYLSPAEVIIENAEFSQAFNSGIYYITPISTNDHLIKKWIFGEIISVKITE